MNPFQKHGRFLKKVLTFYPRAGPKPGAAQNRARRQPSRPMFLLKNVAPTSTSCSGMRCQVVTKIKKHCRIWTLVRWLDACWVGALLVGIIGEGIIAYTRQESRGTSTAGVHRDYRLCVRHHLWDLKEYFEGWSFISERVTKLNQ